MTPDPLAHIRAEVMAQPVEDRAAYALDLLAFYLAPNPPFFDGCRALGLDVPLPDLRVLFALDARRGVLVSMDALQAARSIDRPADEWTCDDKVIRSVKRLRPALRALGLPVEIETVTGLGYRLKAPAGFRFEDAAPADLFTHRARA